MKGSIKGSTYSLMHINGFTERIKNIIFYDKAMEV
jgi:hypothetical protein